MRSRTRWAWASAIWLPRSLAMRTSRDGTPSKRVITAFRLKSTRAVGRENLAKTRPVTSARPSRPMSASSVTSRFAAEPARRHLAVADGGHGLDAEEEGVGEAARARLLDAVPDGEVAEREEQVRAQVGDSTSPKNWAQVAVRSEW